jgi:hypothetical protein
LKSELSFLMDLFLNDEVPSAIKKQVADRIREVEEVLTTIPPLARPLFNVPHETNSAPVQAASMQRIMEAHPDVPVNQAVPATPAAAAALQQRAALISQSMKEKPEMGRTSPRKQ